MSTCHLLVHSVLALEEGEGALLGFEFCCCCDDGFGFFLSSSVDTEAASEILGLLPVLNSSPVQASLTGQSS